MESNNFVTCLFWSHTKTINFFWNLTDSTFLTSSQYTTNIHSVIVLCMLLFLFVWKRICAGFFIVLLIYVLLLEIQSSRGVNRGFEPRSGQSKDYKIGIYCFSAKHTPLRRKSKDWWTMNQNNVSQWNDMSTRGLLSQWASTIQIQLSVLV